MTDEEMHKNLKHIFLRANISELDQNGIVNTIQNHLIPESGYQQDREAYYKKVEKTINLVYSEVFRAKIFFPKNFTNQHEAYAVILEEVDELWDEIKKNQLQYDIQAQRKEAIQAAAMLVRFVVELT